MGKCEVHILTSQSSRLPGDPTSQVSWGQKILTSQGTRGPVSTPGSAGGGYFVHWKRHKRVQPIPPPCPSGAWALALVRWHPLAWQDFLHLLLISPSTRGQALENKRCWTQRPGYSRASWKVLMRKMWCPTTDLQQELCEFWWRKVEGRIHHSYRASIPPEMWITSSHTAK